VLSRLSEKRDLCISAESSVADTAAQGMKEKTGKRARPEAELLTSSYIRVLHRQLLLLSPATFPVLLLRAAAPPVPTARLGQTTQFHGAQDASKTFQIYSVDLDQAPPSNLKLHDTELHLHPGPKLLFDRSLIRQGMLTLTVVLNLQALHFLLYVLCLLCLSLVPEQPNTYSNSRAVGTCKVSFDLFIRCHRQS
jgi:hypothetical protein